MPYEKDGLPDSIPFEWMAWVEMHQEFSREISNSINELTRFTHHLAAWRNVAAPLNDQQKFQLAHEFISPLATLALNLPYVIRSRLIFATAHLCHQANKAREGLKWTDDLPLDSEIVFAQADQYGKPWKPYSKLKVALERIGDKAFQVATGDFRNAYNHRFSPRILVGQTQIVTRKVEKGTGKVSYGYGGIDPLSLDLIVKQLEVVCEHCYKAFDGFRKMVKEHEKAIIGTLSP